MRAAINGNELYVEVLGPDDAPTIIAHHGAPGLADHHETKAGFGPLADEFRIVVFDARGCGASGDRRPFTTAQWTDDVEGLRRWLGCDRVILAGGSFGGCVAMAYAVRYPDHAAALVLRDTIPVGAVAMRIGWAQASERTRIEPATWDRYMRGGLRSDEDLAAIWRRLLPLYEHDFDPGTLDAAVAATPFRYQTQNAAVLALGDYDITPRLGQVRWPALVIAGRHDWLAPPTVARQIADLIPAAELRIFEHSGHAPEVEEPERFRAVVREFLRSSMGSAT